MTVRQSSIENKNKLNQPIRWSSRFYENKSVFVSSMIAQ